MKGSVGTVSSSDINNGEYFLNHFTDQYASKHYYSNATTTMTKTMITTTNTTNSGFSKAVIKEKISVLPVKEILRDHVLSLNVDDCETDGENAFFVADLGVIYRQHIRWKAHLPRIEPFYAVKCNPDPILLKLLAVLGTGFDCASKSEIQTILDLGVDASRIIYANPCKQASFIRYAADHDIRMMTFDNVDEIHKIKRYFPQAQLVLRICVDDSKSVCKLSPKFGASLDTTGLLLQVAKSLGMEVIGVSFHVGSGCYDENIFVDAVHRARFVFDQALKLGYNFHLLDVGGGFSPTLDGDGITFEKVSSLLGPTVDKLFPPNIRVIAEPGRYYSASAFTIATHIIARRTMLQSSCYGNIDGNLDGHINGVANEAETYGITNENITNGTTTNGSSVEGEKHMYYVNDGVYGAFNCILFDHKVVQPKVLCKGGIFTYGQTIEEPEYACSIWGPTCDSMDCITKNGSLPKLVPGDWLYFEEMGAYTICAASQFNGFKKSNVFYTTSDLRVFDILCNDDDDGYNDDDNNNSNNNNNSYNTNNNSDNSDKYYK